METPAQRPAPSAPRAGAAAPQLHAGAAKQSSHDAGVSRPNGGAAQPLSTQSPRSKPTGKPAQAPDSTKRLVGATNWLTRLTHLGRQVKKPTSGSKSKPEKPTPGPIASDRVARNQPAADPALTKPAPARSGAAQATREVETPNHDTPSHAIGLAGLCSRWVLCLLMTALSAWGCVQIGAALEQSTLASSAIVSIKNGPILSANIRPTLIGDWEITPHDQSGPPTSVSLMYIQSVQFGLEKYDRQQIPWRLLGGMGLALPAAALTLVSMMSLFNLGFRLKNSKR